MKKPMVVLFFLLIFATPAMLRAETSSASLSQVASSPEEQVPSPATQVQTSPVPSEQARHSDALGEASAVTANQVGTYEQLVAAIRKARAASVARVEQAVAQEKVRECWEIGKLIDEHVLQHKERADYGKQVILRLSQDLAVSDSELYAMLEFARAYPILPHAGKLTWSDYRELLAVNDKKDRDELTEKAAAENWNRDQIREEVKRRKGTEKGSGTAVPDPFTAKLGKPGTYKMVKVKGGPEMGQLVIDLGFSNYYRTSRPLGFQEGAIIESLVVRPDGNSSPSDKIKLSKRTADDLYTYRAVIMEVLDGDTVNAVVDLGFGLRSVQTLRLRGIDAPELMSKEGKEAKEVLEQMLKSGDSGLAPRDSKKEGDSSLGTRSSGILIRTVKSDKYDRYLADVFVNGVYVNQMLVEKGFAVHVRD